MNTLRLLADDLTGALDSAAAFAPAFGSVRVVWQEHTGYTGPALAFDTGTREKDTGTARARLALLAPFLAGDGADNIRFFKVDSLLRGHAGDELCTLLGVCAQPHVIIAPAIPFQRRITRAGRQMIATDDGWHITGENISATLEAAGCAITRCRTGDPLPPGISLWDTETDADLDAIVTAAAGQPVLWVGAAGLASALARRAGQEQSPAALPAKPILGLVGTDHLTMLEQLADCPHLHLTIGMDANAAARSVDRHLAVHGAAFVTCDLPGERPRRDMEAEIASRFAALAANVPKPGSLFVSGGETLRGLASRIGADAIDCRGQFETGAPISTIIGGIWDGLPLISKSGAFGSPNFLSRLVGSLPA